MSTVIDNSRVRNIPPEQLYQKNVSEVKRLVVKSVRRHLKSQLTSLTNDLELIEILTGYDVVSKFEYEKALPKLPKKTRRVIKNLHAQIDALESACTFVEETITKEEVVRYKPKAPTIIANNDDLLFESTVEKI
jgi:hypothetical protein